MKKFKMEYNIKGNVCLEVPEEGLNKEDLDKEIKEWKKEFNRVLMESLTPVLIDDPKRAGYTAEFKVTKVKMGMLD